MFSANGVTSALFFYLLSMKVLEFALGLFILFAINESNRILMETLWTIAEKFKFLQNVFSIFKA
jgi:hypothetical protein